MKRKLNVCQILVKDGLKKPAIYFKTWGNKTQKHSPRGIKKVASYVKRHS